MEQKHENENDSLTNEIHLIHDYCHKTNLGSSMAKILSYVHAKITQKGFEGLLTGEQELRAIKILLGRSDIINELPHEFRNQFKEFSNTIRKTDNELRDLTGAEYWLGSDLQNRLRFYEDIEYQGDILFTYYAEIAPVLNIEFAIALSA